MKNKKNFNVGKMHIEIFLPSEKLPDNVVTARQRHGTNIAVVESLGKVLEEYDGLVTKSRNLALGIKTADCAPICFSDGKMIGVAHIGWRGLCLGLIGKMLPYFNTMSLDIYVGPFLNSFEIKKDFCYDQIVRKFGEKFFSNESDKLIFNFREAIASLLPPQTVYDPRDTGIDVTFPSYRRNKTSGNFVTAVSFR